MTNYERIKAMSVEELSDILPCPIYCGSSEMECEKNEWCTCLQCEINPFYV